MDEANLPSAFPFLDAGFALNGLFHRFVHLVVDELVNAIFFGEAVDEVLFVDRNAVMQAACYARVENAVWRAGHDVDAGFLDPEILHIV